MEFSQETLETLKDHHHDRRFLILEDPSLFLNILFSDLCVVRDPQNPESLIHLSPKPEPKLALRPY